MRRRENSHLVEQKIPTPSTSRSGFLDSSLLPDDVPDEVFSMDSKRLSMFRIISIMASVSESFDATASS